MGVRPAARQRSISRSASARQRAADRVSLFGRCRLRRQDRESVIGLHGIGIDHRAAMPLGERERQRRLAAGRRAGDDDDALIHAGRNDLLGPRL
jgi:hypothetical protein